MRRLPRGYRLLRLRDVRRHCEHSVRRLVRMGKQWGVRRAFVLRLWNRLHRLQYDLPPLRRDDSATYDDALMRRSAKWELVHDPYDASLLVVEIPAA